MVIFFNNLKLKILNNHRQTNKRGVNPTGFRMQITDQPEKVKFTLEDGSVEIQDNPKYPGKRRIYHKV